MVVWKTLSSGSNTNFSNINSKYANPEKFQNILPFFSLDFQINIFLSSRRVSFKTTMMGREKKA